MATISDRPWGGFTAADYTPQQWKAACLVHMAPAAGQDPLAKGLHKVPVREPDGTLSRGGVHAAVGGHGIGAVTGISDAQRRSAAKQLVGFYEDDLKEEPPASLEALAGISEAADQAEDAAEGMTGMTGRSRQYYDRSFLLEGIEILSRAKGGDGRTVEAFAAVFDSPTEIHDQHGRYTETIHRAAFNRQLNDRSYPQPLCLYNHGMNVVDGKPSGLAQVPLGSPVEIRAEQRGLLTVTRYNKGELADSVLEAIRNEDIRAQSFRGAIYESNPSGRIPRTRPGQTPPTVVRIRLGLSDYGPTPRPYYKDAAILAVRAAQEIYSDIASLDRVERAELFRMMLATTRESDQELATATPYLGPGSEDQRDAHSGRNRDLARQRELAVWAELAAMEMAVHGQATERDAR